MENVHARDPLNHLAAVNFKRMIGSLLHKEEEKPEKEE